MTSESKLTLWLRQFTRALNETTEEIRQELDNLSRQRDNIKQIIKEMTKFNTIDSQLQKVLDIMNVNIQSIEK